MADPSGEDAVGGLGLEVAVGGNVVFESQAHHSEVGDGELAILLRPEGELIFSGFEGYLLLESGHLPVLGFEFCDHLPVPQELALAVSQELVVVGGVVEGHLEEGHFFGDVFEPLADFEGLCHCHVLAVVEVQCLLDLLRPPFVKETGLADGDGGSGELPAWQVGDLLRVLGDHWHREISVEDLVDRTAQGGQLDVADGESEAVGCSFSLKGQDVQFVFLGFQHDLDRVDFVVLGGDLEDLFVPGNCASGGVDGGSFLGCVVEGKGVFVSLEPALAIEVESLF